MTRTAGSLLLLMCVLSCLVLADDSPVLTGPYLGQRPPGNVPQMFARGIVSIPANFEHSAAVFSPDMRQVFWCTIVDRYTSNAGDWLQHLYTARLVDGAWTEPERAPFTAHLNTPISRPVFSPDGSQLYLEYGSNPNRESDANIYVSDRTDGGWTEPVPVSPLINSSSVERLHCVGADGSLYFSRDPFTSREKIFVSRCVDGAFAEPERLGEPFDSEASELALVLAPDESYVLIAATRAGVTDEFYISYREPDDVWTERVRLPFGSGGFLALSPDGEYLFFLGEGIFWISTSFVEDLKPEHLR